MKNITPSLIILVVYASATIAYPLSNYTRLRDEILKYEQRLMIGANLSLTEVEQAANKILMKAKQEELRAGFNDPRLFAPARNFLEAKNDIDGSKVFQLIRRMPKGAVLHSHDIALVSGDYIYYNVTYRDDLYVCIEKGVVELRFFRAPDDSCSWELLKNVRRDPTRGAMVNDMIKKRMSMLCDDPASAYSNVDRAWHKFMDVFAFVRPLLTYRPVYEDYFLEALKQLSEDNVMYLELRSTLPTLYDFDGTKYKPQDLVGIYRNLTRRFKQEHPDFIGAKLIYAPTRSGTYEQAKDYVQIMTEIKELYPDFVAGFDLVGQEDKGHTLEEFADLLKEVEKRNISFFFHAGETNWLGAPTDENLVDAILLNTRRIGHGYALASHPFLMELVKRMGIAIEVNPISNQVLKLVDDLRNHPARSLFAEGYAVVVSNDDPSFWGARALSYDFYEAFMALMSNHADLKSLKQLALNSFIYSSLDNYEKQKAIDSWYKAWQKYVEDVAIKKW